jgi:hypothetical protein
VTAVGDARQLFSLVRKGIDSRAVAAHVRKPFRFLLCGDPALVVAMRALLLSGHAGGVPLDAAACLETIGPGSPLVTNPGEVRAVIFLGYGADAAAAGFEPLQALRVPILAVTVDPTATPAGPNSPPAAGASAEYVVTAIQRDVLREHLFRPFRTTKETGFGIGLYECKTIVEGAGGSIDVRSQEHVGTTVTARIPRPVPGSTTA